MSVIALLGLSLVYLLLSAAALLALVLALALGCIGILPILFLNYAWGQGRRFWKWWYTDWAAARAGELDRVALRQWNRARNDRPCYHAYPVFTQAELDVDE